MLLHIVFFVAGLVALVAGASSLVRGASKLALSVGISPLVVGLTIVAFGTSAPEMAVTVGATLEGQYDIAVGNVIGSNIFNVLFILGVSALIVPLVVHSQLIRQEVPIMIGASLLVLALGLDGAINWIDGAILFGLLLFYTAFLVIQSRRATKAESADFDAELQPAAANEWDAKLPVQIVLIVIGLVLLVLGSGWGAWCRLARLGWFFPKPCWPSTSGSCWRWRWLACRCSSRGAKSRAGRARCSWATTWPTWRT